MPNDVSMPLFGKFRIGCGITERTSEPLDSVMQYCVRHLEDEIFIFITLKAIYETTTSTVRSTTHYSYYSFHEFDCQFSRRLLKPQQAYGLRCKLNSPLNQPLHNPLGNALYAIHHGR